MEASREKVPAAALATGGGSCGAGSCLASAPRLGSPFHTQHLFDFSQALLGTWERRIYWLRFLVFKFYLSVYIITENALGPGLYAIESTYLRWLRHFLALQTSGLSKRCIRLFVLLRKRESTPNPWRCVLKLPLGRTQPVYCGAACVGRGPSLDAGYHHSSSPLPPGLPCCVLIDVWFYST